MSSTSSPMPLVSSATLGSLPKMAGTPMTQSAPSTGPATEPRPPITAMDTT